MADQQMEEDVSHETPAASVFRAPSINSSMLFNGASYTHFSAVPPSLLPTAKASPTVDDESPALGPACALGVDEAGRGPVLGPMVYGLFFLPLPLADPLLRNTHHFDDSKVLTPTVRSNLMEKLCTPGTDLYTQCGWAVEVMSARDIGANMMKPATYNLNEQAMDATIGLIEGVYKRGVNVREIYIDTIGNPATYQKKLERIFPTAKITVAKKADSLYPCVSAASVCAKVTRDAALEVLHENYIRMSEDGKGESEKMSGSSTDAKSADEESWGSGYPSDARCTSWLKRNMDPVFGWGNECRFSWGTAKDMLDSKGAAAKVEWPIQEDDETSRMTDFFSAEREKDSDELGLWFGRAVGTEVF